jgi:hypothetical protein
MNPYFDQIVAQSQTENGTNVDTVKFLELAIKQCVEAVQERKISYGRAITDRYWLEHCLRRRFGLPVDPQEPQ